MFVRPRMLPELVTFVTWHHVFYWIAFTCQCAHAHPRSAIVAPGRRMVGGRRIRRRVRRRRRARPRRHLPRDADRDNREAYAVVPGALLPLVWLAVIDHLAGGVPSPANRVDRTTGQRPLLAACLTSAVFLWAAHLVAASAARPDHWQRPGAGVDGGLGARDRHRRVPRRLRRVESCGCGRRHAQARVRLRVRPHGGDGRRGHHRTVAAHRSSGLCAHGR